MTACALKTTDHWPADNWPHLSEQIRQHINDLSFRFAGHWQPRHVRIDLPSFLAEQSPDQYAPLLKWMTGQKLSYQLLGSTRQDVRVEISGPGTAIPGNRYV
jgi:hypothetical protein